MTEQQLRDGLSAAVAEEPPLGFDPYGVPGRWRARRRRRRTVVAAVVATVAVFGGGAVVSRAVLPPSTVAPADGSAPDRSVAPIEPEVEYQPSRAMQAEVERVQAYVEARVRALVPDVGEVSATGASLDIVDGVPRLRDVDVDFYKGTPDITRLVAVRIAPVGGGGLRELVCPGSFPCRDVRAADGTVVPIVETKPAPSQAARGQQSHVARHVRPDGSAVVVQNFDRTVLSTGKPASFALTDDQLVALATDPELTLTAPPDPVDPAAPGAPDGSGAAQVARIREHVRTTLDATVPGARDVAVSPNRRVDLPGAPVETVSVLVTFTVDQGPAVLEVLTSTSGEEFAPASRCGESCRRVPVPDGTTLLIDDHAVTPDDGPDAVPYQSARHYRSDGSTAVVLVESLPDRTTFPITEEQLVALATDPELVLPPA